MLLLMEIFPILILPALEMAHRIMTLYIFYRKLKLIELASKSQRRIKVRLMHTIPLCPMKQLTNARSLTTLLEVITRQISSASIPRDGCRWFAVTIYHCFLPTSTLRENNKSTLLHSWSTSCPCYLWRLLSTCFMMLAAYSIAVSN